MTRQLIMIDWEDERPVSSLPLYYPPCISPRMNLVDVLQLLQKGGSHIAFVCAGRLSFRQILSIRNRCVTRQLTSRFPSSAILFPRTGTC